MLHWIKKIIGWLPIGEVVELILFMLKSFVLSTGNKIDDKIYVVIEGLMKVALSQPNALNLKEIIANLIITLLEILADMTGNDVDDKLVIIVRKMLYSAIGVD